MAARGDATLVRVTLATMLASMAGGLPLFLVGATVVLMRDDLRLGAVGLGAAAAVFRGTQALVSGMVGSAVDRVGATRSLRTAMALSLLACLGIAGLAGSWWQLCAFLVVAGLGKAAVQPAANRLVVLTVPVEQRGLIIGWKQSGAPLGALLAGLLVPVIAVTWGWRAAYLAAAAVIIGCMVVVPSRERASGSTPRGAPPELAAPVGGAYRRAVAGLGLGAALANVASSSLPVFWVDSATSRGMSAGLAGSLLAVSGVVAIGARVGSGALCDRMRTRQLWLCVGLLGTGAVGLALLGAGGPAWQIVGFMLAQGGAWGFPAAFWFVALRMFASVPGRASGHVVSGALVGSSGGPVLIGAIAARGGYPMAWLAASVLALVAAAVLVRCDSIVRQDPASLTCAAAGTNPVASLD